MKKKYNVTLWIFIGLVSGVILGLVMPDALVTPLSVISSIYMSALRMMIYPLVFCSLVMGIVGIGSIAKTGKIGLHAILWYVGTTAFASALGLILPKALGLGKGITITMMESDTEAASFSGLLDTVTSLIPANPFTAFTEGNMLQVLVFAIIIGFCCLVLKDKAKAFVDVCNSVNEISVFIVGKVMLFTPLGVFASIACVMHSNGVSTMVELAQVMIALYITYFLYAVIIYGGMVKLFAKYPIGKFYKDIAPAALNAFGTCSSSATIPISMQCAQDNLGIDEEVCSLSLPLGATINMDAVSIVMSFMITFFGTACGVPISTNLMIVVLLSNVLLSIGTPGVPGGAIAAFAALSQIAGLPAGVMGVYISVNTLADMGATCVNVIGDLACSTVISRKLGLYKKGDATEVKAE